MTEVSLAIFSIIALAFMLGALIGSRMTKVIFRLALPKDARRGPSICPNCGRRLRASDQIPVISYLKNQGKCRRCGERISPLYLWTEIICGAIVPFCLFYYNFTLHALIMAGVFILFYALTVIDARTMRLPDSLVLMVALFALLDIIVEQKADGEGILMGLIPAALLFLVRLISRGGVGLGDIKLTGAAGLLLGWPLILPALILAVILAVPEALVRLIRGVKKFSFGPYLCMGFTLALLYPREILALWGHLIEFIS